LREPGPPMSARMPLVSNRTNARSTSTARPASAAWRRAATAPARRDEPGQGDRRRLDARHRPAAPAFHARRSFWRRQLRDAPAAPEGLHQQHAGAESAPQNIDLISLVRERDGLRGDDLEVVVHPSSVAIREQLERFLGRLYRPPLLLGLLLGDAERRQVVLHLLERGQGGLLVGRD